MDRMLDKRKARDKESDSDTTDTSLNKNPTKRARVEYSPLKKEKSPSPAAAQKSPMGKSLDSSAAATPVSPMDQKSDNNGDLTMTSANPPVISKFDLPSPFTTQELEQMGKNNDRKDDSDSDNDSTKFFSDIIQGEQNKRKRQTKSSSNSTNSKKDDSRSSNGPSTSNSKQGEKASSSTSSKSNSKSSQHPIMTSSPNSSEMSLNLNSLAELEVTLKITDVSTRTIILEDTVLKSDLRRMDAFLRQHNMKLSVSSQSGYLGDVSSLESSAGAVPGSSKSSRWTISSLGSTIPRQSIVSIATNASDSPEELMKRPGKPPLHSKSRKRSDGPIASSTKIEEDSSFTMDSTLEKMSVSENVLSNGDDYALASTSSSSGGKSQSSRATESSSPKKGKLTPMKHERDEGISTMSQTSTPGSARKNKGTLKTSSTLTTKETPSSSSSVSASTSAGRTGKKPGQRRRGGSASNFPITPTSNPNALSAVLSTPPPVRSVAKIEGTTAKPVSKFEAELNNEPVIESELQKASTLWSSIVQGELVFARWRDKNYYSGMVKTKGHNDTWIIDFDDGMEDVASESHIVPIRILGVGVKGIYSPDTGYDPHSAEVVGQKFIKDPELESSIVVYAIRCQGEDKPIWCSRRQLSIREIDAKKYRAEYQPPVVIKAGDVSLDNIVSGPRRRTRGNEGETAPENRLGLDTSTSEGTSESTTTPKPRGPRGGKKTPASEAKKKRPASTATPIPAKEASVSPPAKDAAKESPSNSKVQKAVVEVPKKRPRKPLFQGMQFFLTASGGGDPGISGTPVIPPIPYDKDEYRELIENNGGEVIDVVGDEGKENVYLISDSYARTVKYIYCLAAAIPCLSHVWIKTSLDKNEILEWNIFQLPAGWSLENQDLVQHHDRKPMKGCKIYVTSESDQLYNYWKPVLTAAEATLLKPPRKKGTAIPSGTEVVVTDNHCESIKNVLDEAEALNLPVVKPEWLVQTIITGEKAHMYGHEKYKVVITETEEDTEDGGTGEESGHFNEVLANMDNPD